MTFEIQMILFLRTDTLIYLFNLLSYHRVKLKLRTCSGLLNNKPDKTVNTEQQLQQNKILILIRCLEGRAVKVIMDDKWHSPW